MANKAEIETKKVICDHLSLGIGTHPGTMILQADVTAYEKVPCKNYTIKWDLDSDTPLSVIEKLLRFSGVLALNNWNAVLHMRIKVEGTKVIALGHDTLDRWVTWDESASTVFKYEGYMENSNESDIECKHCHGKREIHPLHENLHEFDGSKLIPCPHCASQEKVSEK